MSVSIKYQLFAISPAGNAFRPLEWASGDSHDFEWNEEDYGMAFKEFVRTRTGSYDNTRRAFSIGRELIEHTFELRRYADKAWRQREAARLKAVYTPLPPEWKALSLPKDHFTHVASGGDSSDLITYTESEEKGERDIQTRTKAGKYIKKFFPSLSNDEVRYYASAVQSLNGVKMTDDPALATTIYENGPSSCMKLAPNRWAWATGKKAAETMPRHPVEMYFAGDLQLAWLGSPEKADARALVWPEKKLYGRLYGAVDRLKTALERAGYKNGYNGDGNAFSGARMKMVRYDRDQIVMPYLDGIGELEYVYDTGAIHFGTTNSVAGKKTIRFYRQGTTSGLAAFRDPLVVVCSITGKTLRKNARTIELVGGGRSTLKIATEHGYLLANNGLYTNHPVLVIDENDVQTVYPDPYTFRAPRGYIEDAFAMIRPTYRPAKVCIKVDEHRYMYRGDKQFASLILVDKKAYTSLERYYALTGDNRKIVRHGPYSPSEHARLVVRCNKYLSLHPHHGGKNFKELFLSGDGFFQALVSHFGNER